jgi:hypothetical protein
MDTSRLPEVGVLPGESCSAGCATSQLTISYSSSTPAAPSVPPTSTTTFLNTQEYVPRGRSRSRDLRRRLPPRPIVEDEAISLARESDSSSIASDDPPLRGVIEQHPIILEADVTEDEAARLHSAPRSAKDDDNPERRFVLLPKPDSPPNRRAANLATPDAPRESIPRRRSRQDLPALQTKVPREGPVPFRRTTSAQSTVPGDKDVAPKRPPNPRAQSDLLSPDTQRHPAALSPRHFSESQGSRSNTPSSARHNSGPSSRPGTPQDKRNSGGIEAGGRSRPDPSEKQARPQQAAEEGRGQRRGRQPSPHSKKLSADADRRRSARSSSRSNQVFYTSDSDIADSDSDRDDKHRHRHHQHRRYRELQAEEEARRRRKNSSPLPSPKVSPNQLNRADRERAETFPQRSGSRSPDDRSVSPFSPAVDTPRTSGERLNPRDPIPRPRSRQSNPIPIPAAKTYPSHLPEASPSAKPSRVEPKASVSRHAPPPQPPPPQWQPPPFQPSTSAEIPVGSYRRFSEDVDRGAIIPLPTCPRTTYTRAHNDWLTLPRCPSAFDICPSCFNSTIATTEHRQFFMKSPHRPPDAEVLCDFGSSPWYRIAWLITRKERRHDMKLFYGLANVSANYPQCLGKHEAVRQWYFLVDPKTRAPIHNFHVCASCVKSVEVILPAVRGLFQRDPNRPMGPSRICDFRFDSKRFIKYFDTLETTADKADENDAPPDPRPLVNLAKRMAKLPECQRDKDLIDRSWNVITQLPEFTVCEECFDEIVWPELEEKAAIPMMFNKALQRLPKASCQLYSPKMRGIFRTAVDVDDYKLLASKARERKTVETAYKSNLESLKRQASQGKINPQFVAMETRRVEEEWAKWA